MDLREYEQKKFAIAEILRRMSYVVSDDQSDRKERLRGLFARLAEDRFNLVVVGRFSRGKTSLMNAILGTDRLPTGIAPLTSVITTVTYGSVEQAVLKYRNRVLDQVIPIESLPRYITQDGNPGNVQGIQTAEIQLPCETLRRGVYFVDTPGFGSVIVENTLTTESFLPEADAFVLVTSYESPLSDDEMRFFKAGAASGKPIFIVMNKHDLVSAADRRVAVAFVRKEVEQVFGRATPQVFSVSSTEGLQAKRAGDASRLAASGIVELESQILEFLLKEKNREFLLRMCERIQDLLQEFPSSAEAAHLKAQAGGLLGSIGRENGRTSPLGGADTLANLHQIDACEICRHIADKLWDFLCRYQQAIIVSEEEQRRFASRGGFCPFHTWEYESIASPYGTCNGYPTLLDRLSSGLRDAASSTGHRGALLARLQRLLPSQDECLLCRVRAEAEEEAIAATAKRLDDDHGKALKSLSAICLPHFAMLVDAVREDEAARGLIEHQAAVLERFSEDMRRYALKHDAVRRYLASREETTVAKRALLAVAGHPRVNFTPRPADAPSPGVGGSSLGKSAAGPSIHTVRGAPKAMT